MNIFLPYENDIQKSVPNWVKAMQDLGEAFNDNTIKGE